jgi:antitoxin MazE
MKTRVQKWGNSLALRIPKAMVVEANLAENSAVDLSIVKGKLVVAPVVEPPISLAELLRKVTDDNLHHAWDTGRPVGKEIW